MSNYGPNEARGGEFRKICHTPECGKVFYTDRERQDYCCNKCKRRAQNLRYYPQHRTAIVERVKKRGQK